MLSIKTFPLTNNHWDALFDNFWNTLSYTNYTNVNYTSKVENNKLYLNIDVPGVKKDDLSFDYDKGYLMLDWTRNKNKKYQSWYVGEKYDFTKADVKLEDGVLSIEVPLKKESSSSRIKLLK